MNNFNPLEHLVHLKDVITYLTLYPDTLHHPELEFFRNYLTSLGASIPPKMSTKEKPKQSEPAPSKPEKTEPTNQSEEKIESDHESDVELDMEGVVEPDALSVDQKMGDPEKIPTEEETDQANEKRMQAMAEVSESNNEKAIELFTEAILLNPTSALFYAKRGQCYLKLTKPNACIKDCNRALELNPDSAAAFKFRGRAYRLLGEWEKAVKDLSQACNIDFDEQTDEWLREVKPNAQKVFQHRLKLQRKMQEKDLKAREERVRNAKEAHAQAAAAFEEKSSKPEPDYMADVPPGLEDFCKMLNDPEIMAEFQDPEVAAAFRDITANPANFMKYQSKPKIGNLMAKISSKFAEFGKNFEFPPGSTTFRFPTPPGGGFPGGPPGGGFPGFPGFPGGPTGPQDDAGLD